MGNSKPDAKRESGQVLKNYTYTDERGLNWIMKAPTEAEASIGIPVGPPDLAELGLPESIEKRLNAELFSRRLITLRDVRARPNEVYAALQRAYKIDATKIINLYREVK